MARKMNAAAAFKLWETTHPDSLIFIEPGTSQYLRDTYITHTPKGISDDLKIWAKLITEGTPSVPKSYLIREVDQIHNRGRTTSDSSEFENFMIQLLTEGYIKIDPRSERLWPDPYFGDGHPSPTVNPIQPQDNEVMTISEKIEEHDLRWTPDYRD